MVKSRWPYLKNITWLAIFVLTANLTAKSSKFHTLFKNLDFLAPKNFKLKDSVRTQENLRIWKFSSLQTLLIASRVSKNFLILRPAD